MKNLTFNRVSHSPHGWTERERYAIDWDTQEDRRYKVPINGLWVYEDNSIVLKKVGDHNPDWRNHLRNGFGIETMLVSEMTGYTLHDPNGGRRVSKKTMIEQGCYHFDKERMRLYDLKQWDIGRFLYWPSWDAEPQAGHQVSYSVPNKERQKALIERLQPYLDLGTTLRQMNSHGGTYFQWRGMLWEVRRFQEGKYNDLTSDEAQRFASTLANNITFLPRVAAEVTKDEFKNDYLIVKESK